MPLINFKSNLSNFRRVIKPKPTDGQSTKPVPFGEYIPISNNLDEYTDDRYSFSTKPLESFERKKINEQFETDSVLEKDSKFDDIIETGGDPRESKVVNFTQTPNTLYGDKLNNEESPIRVNNFENTDNKDLQAKTIQPVSQEDRTSGLVSKFELKNKIDVSEPKKLETLSSKFDIDGKPRQLVIGGRYENGKQSIYGFPPSIKPTVDAFSNEFSKGFVIKNGSNFTSKAFEYSWAGGKENGPSVDFFSNEYVKGGFKKFQQLNQTEFKLNSLPQIQNVDYFDNTYSKNFKQKQTETAFTDKALNYIVINAVDAFDNRYNKNFVINSKLYETNYTTLGLNFGLSQLSTTNFFDISNAYTISGFTRNQQLFATDFNAEALDWGLKGNYPTTDFFDLGHVFTNTGFTFKQPLLATDFNAFALDYGLQGRYPTTDFFDQGKQFTNTGFTFRQPLLTTDFNAAALDWGLKGIYPTTDFFDQLKQFTNTGFTFRQPLLTTDFNAAALDWGLKGIYPTTDFFDQGKQFTNTGFTFRQQLLITDFNAAALDWGLKGLNPTTDFFDQIRQYTIAGFVSRQQPLTTDFNAAALDWGLKGANPSTDFFDQSRQYTNAGFVIRQPLLGTDFNSSALDWGLQGTNPSTNFFDLGRTYTTSGFVIRQAILSTDFNASALDWGLKGTNPSTNFFDISNVYTTAGFVIRQPLLTTDFNPSALDWGLKGTNPSTDFFDRTKQFTVGGFVIRQPLRTTDFTTSALDYSLINIPPVEGGAASANVANINGKNYGEVNFFDVTNQYTTKGFHVLAKPFEPTSYKTNSTQFFNVPASDFEIPRIGSPNYRLDAQLVKSPLFANSGFIKQNNSTYLELMRGQNYGSFLGDAVDTRGNPTLLDIQYEKYDLQEESINSLAGIVPGLDVRQPYIIRGIQKRGQVDNERWGFGVSIDDGLIRGGAAVAADRAINDVLRLTKWSASTKGVLYLAKQIGLQLSNPNTEAGIISGTKIYQPLSPLLSAGLRPVGGHPPRHGLIPLVESARYGDVIKDRSILFDLDPSLANRNIQISSELGLFDRSSDGVKIGEDQTPIGTRINTISGLTGPNSLYGIGFTDFYRNSNSIPLDAYAKYSPETNPLFTAARYEDTIRELTNLYDEDKIKFNRNVQIAKDLFLLTDESSTALMGDFSAENKVYIGQRIDRISSRTGGTEIHRTVVSSPANLFQKYTTKYQYASSISRSSTKSKDTLRSAREANTGASSISFLRNAYLAFASKQTPGILFKTNSDKDPLILNFGTDGANDSINYINTIKSSIEGIYPSDVDVRSPHTLRNPLPFSYYGDKSSLAIGAWSADGNVDRPFIDELEQYGIISNRTKGYYAPTQITLGVNITQNKSTLNLYKDSSILSNAANAKVGPLSEQALVDLSESGYKLNRLYSLLTNSAKQYQTKSDVDNAFFSEQDGFDLDDNIDLKFYVKNLLNPFNKIVIDKNGIGDTSSDGYLNINRKVSNMASTDASIYKSTAVNEYAVMSYNQMLGNYNDPLRRNVSVATSAPGTAASLKPLNNPRFHDFRYKVQPLIEANDGNYFPSAKAGRVNFISNPEILKYRSNNLEDAAGFGQHGMPGVDRTNPVLSFLCGRVSSGYRDLRGEQYGGIHKFRGDRVNLTDFRHDKSTTDINEIYEMGENSLIPGQKDLIEFYVTGMNARDRVIVFRAAFTEVQDNFIPSWETVKYLNRADPVYIYKGFEREVSLNFSVGITSRDELRTRWRSLNALAGFTAPEYINSNDPTFDGRMKAPLMKLTLGHLFRSTPCIVTSLNYNFDNSQVVWETAKLTRWVNGREIVETITTDDLDDPACCVALQLPKMINVSMTLKIIGNYRPQSNGGRTGYPDMGIFYNLYASDDSYSDGLLPRKGGIYVNYMNRECTVIVDRTPETPPLVDTPTPPKDNPRPEEPPPLQDAPVGKKDPPGVPKDPPAVDPPPQPPPPGLPPQPPPPAPAPPPTEPPPLEDAPVGGKDGKQSSITNKNKGATTKSQPTRGKTGGKGNTNTKSIPDADAQRQRARLQATP
jgi:hypothetical protein